MGLKIILLLNKFMIIVGVMNNLYSKYTIKNITKQEKYHLFIKTYHLYVKKDYLYGYSLL